MTIVSKNSKISLWPKSVTFYYMIRIIENEVAADLRQTKATSDP